MYTKIRESFWTDEKVCRIPDKGKLAYLYLLTSPHRNILGLYRLPVAYMACDLCWEPREANEAIKCLEEAGLIVYDEKSAFVLVRGFLKHNRPENPNQIKAAMARLKEVEGNPLLPALYQELNGMEDTCLDPLRNRLETLLDPFGNSSETVREPFGNRFGTVSDKEEEEEEEEEKEKGEEEEEEEEEGRPRICAARKSLSPGGDQPHKPRLSRIKVPYQQIVDLYNNLCPGLPKVVTLNDERKRALSARWHTSPEFQTLAFWQGFWERVWLADWLCGRIEGKDGRSFMADFDWCIRPRNFTRIIEGRYDPKPGRGKAARSRIDALAEKDPQDILREAFGGGGREKAARNWVDVLDEKDPQDICAWEPQGGGGPDLMPIHSREGAQNAQEER